MIKIGIDAYGGDYGFKEVVKAIIKHYNKNITYVLFGDENIIRDYFSELYFDVSNKKIKFVNCTQKIEMNDHPVLALRSKSNSSIYVGGQALKNNDIDIFISAGNTGALVALAQFYLKPLDFVDRPVIASILPSKNGPIMLADSGCNVDSKPEWLYQYAILCSAYYNKVFNIDKPKIGLLSVGTEENKGNTLTLATYKLLKNNSELNFVGNIEARDIPYGVVDIVITDGFSGNVFLKTYEGTAKLLLTEIKSAIMSKVSSKIGGLLIKPALKKLLKKYDAKNYGGAPIIGANYFVLKAHGNAKETEYISAFDMAYNLVKNDVMKCFKNINFSR